MQVACKRGAIPRAPGVCIRLPERTAVRTVALRHAGGCGVISWSRRGRGRAQPSQARTPPGPHTQTGCICHTSCGAVSTGGVGHRHKQEQGHRQYRTAVLRTSVLYRSGCRNSSNTLWLWVRKETEEHAEPGALRGGWRTGMQSSVSCCQQAHTRAAAPASPSRHAGTCPSREGPCTVRAARPRARINHLYHHHLIARRPQGALRPGLDVRAHHRLVPVLRQRPPAHALPGVDKRAAGVRGGRVGWGRAGLERRMCTRVRKGTARGALRVCWVLQAGRFNASSARARSDIATARHAGGRQTWQLQLPV